MNFPHSATIQRSALVGTKYLFATVGTTDCFVQPINAEEVQLYGIVFSKGFGCYLPFATDVQIGDRLTHNGQTYGIKGINAYNYGRLRHKKAMLERS